MSQNKKNILNIFEIKKNEKLQIKKLNKTNPSSNTLYKFKQTLKTWKNSSLKWING